MAKFQTSITGACGEHFVASYLSAMGFVVALTRAGTPSTDIIVTSVGGGRSISLQVKTGRSQNRVTYKKDSSKDYWVWRAGAKAIERSNKYHWYAFAALGDWQQVDESPSLFFVPSKRVTSRLRENAEAQREWFWLSDDEAETCRGVAGVRQMSKLLGEARE